MKKIILVLVLISFVFIVKAQKYVVYADSLSAQHRIDSINKVMRPLWILKGDKVTNCYDVVKSNNRGDKWCVEVIQGYEIFFVNDDVKSLMDVTIDASWKRPVKEIGEIKPIR